MRKIKVVVFDFDDTLYKANDCSKLWNEYCKIGLRYMFRELTDAQFDELLKKENIQIVRNNTLIKVLQKYNKNIQDWLDYRACHNCEIDFSQIKKISNDELKKFASRYTLYIVSNNVPTGIKFISKKTGLDLSIFKEIITNDYKNDIGKKQFYEYIIKKEKIKPNELFVIGDDYSTDILPAKEIGAEYALVNSCDFSVRSLGL